MKMQGFTRKNLSTPQIVSILTTVFDAYKVILAAVAAGQRL